MRFVGRRRRRRSVAILFPVLVSVAVCAFSTYSAVGNHASWTRTHRVQHHGAQASGRVTDVTTTTHSGRSKSYSSKITVALAAPVLGEATTVVHLSSRTLIRPGQSITVLLDPVSPKYAELPGHATTSSSTWKIATGFAVLFGALSVGMTVLAVRLLRRKPDAHAA